MRLPIPIITKQGNVYTDVEVTKPKSSVIADTRKMLDTGEVFQSIKIFLGGSITSVSGEDAPEITDKVSIRNIISLIPYRSAEVCLYEILILYDPEKDAVEGVYTCPRCGSQIITELIDNDDVQMDTRDYISSLEVTYMESDYTNITLQLTEPVVIKDKRKDEVLVSIESLELRHPLLSDCIVAEKKYGSKDAIRMQFALYAEALTKINSNEAEKKDRNMYGVYIFENIREAKKDLGALNDFVTQYGIDPNLIKTCRKCGKEFKVPINMSNFFVSGLTL